VVRTPAPNGALDVGPSLELPAKRTPCQVGYFLIGREAEANELIRRQIANASAQIGWENPIEADALLETNDAVLSAKGHGPGEQDSEEKRNRYQDGPPVDESLVADEIHRHHEHVDEQYGKSEEVPRRNPPTVCAQRLRLICHRGSLLCDPASTRRS